MRSRYIWLFLGVLGLWGLFGMAACSSNSMDAGCPAGMVACGTGCIPTGSACGSPDGGGLDDGGNPDAQSDAGFLTGLSLSSGSLSPAFAPATTVYAVQVSYFINSVQVTPTAADLDTTILINGAQVFSGTPSAPIKVGPTPTMITIFAQTIRGDTRSYGIAVTRASNTAVDYLKASNVGAGDGLGYSVSLSGDTLAVGAWQEASNATGVNGNQSDNSLTSAGAVYVFQRTGTSWAQQAYLKASNTGAGDRFGWSLSLSGDTLAVGARLEASAATGVNGNQADNSLTSAGAVYVFQRTGTAWAQQAYVKASNTGANDQFGYSVSLSGDTLAVGAPIEASNATGINGNQTDNSANVSGAVYVFQRTGTLWVQQAYVKASNTDANDQFGYSVSLSGDTLAVGANQESSNATGINGNQADNSAAASGAAYVFQRTGTSWAQQAYRSHKTKICLHIDDSALHRPSTADVP